MSASGTVCSLLSSTFTSVICCCVAIKNVLPFCKVRHFFVIEKYESEDIAFVVLVNFLLAPSFGGANLGIVFSSTEDQDDSGDDGD